MGALRDVTKVILKGYAFVFGCDVWWVIVLLDGGVFTHVGYGVTTEWPMTHFSITGWMMPIFPQINMFLFDDSICFMAG